MKHKVPRYMTSVSHLKRARQRMKTCEDYTFCRESYGKQFVGLSRHLVHRFSNKTTKPQQRLLEAP
jgi:hypothetical protein